MERELIDKVVVVTGGAGDIGYGISNKYLEQGAKIVIIVDINKTRGDEAIKKLTDKYGENKAVFINGDVAKDLDRIYNTIIDTYKTVDVLVQAAGISDPSIPKRLIEIDLVAIIDWAFKFETFMRKDKGIGGMGGTIVLVSSVFGFRVFPFYSVYQAAKYGVVGFTQSMGHMRNYKKTGVRVYTLSPGFTDTQMTKSIRDAEYQKTKMAKDFAAYINEVVFQPVEAVSKAAVETFKKADSGTVWVIEEGKLAKV